MVLALVTGALLATPAFADTFSAHGDERLGALIREALENNPRILKAFADHQAALHRVSQASALPDPRISLTQYARSVETRVGSQQRVLTVTQEIPGVGERAAGRQVASKSAAAIDEAYQAERAEAVRRLKHLYYDIGYLDLAVATSQEEEHLFEQFEEIARNRFAQGVGLQGDVIRLQSELSQVLGRRQLLLRQRVDLETLLNSLRDLPPDTPLAKVRLAALPGVEMDGKKLSELGRRMRPEMKAALLRLEEREKRVQLARIRHRPDFTVGVSWGNIRARGAPLGGIPPSRDGKDAYAVTAGMTVPLFRGKYDAGIREAAEDFAAARFAYREAANSMESEIRSASYRLGSIREQFDLFETTVAPQLEEALTAVRAAYANGESGVTGLIEIQRSLLGIRLGSARLRADYLKALADLERAVGSALPEESQS